MRIIINLIFIVLGFWLFGSVAMWGFGVLLSAIQFVYLTIMSIVGILIGVPVLAAGTLTVGSVVFIVFIIIMILSFIIGLFRR